jgi:lipopolysaccharide/colanic/teichoic acid biosynthesis glycosyltransferase
MTLHPPIQTVHEALTDTKAVSGFEELLTIKTPWWKRSMDIFVAIAFLIVFAPVMLTIAVIIRLTSSGPVLYRQNRIGTSGRAFTFLKFRSMYYACDQSIHQEHIEKLSNGDIDLVPNGDNSYSSYKIHGDERVTKFGAFLRRTSLDELPQLFNVIRGQMSLVGPRPYPVYQTEKCTQWQRTRHMIRPGITGLSQVDARYNISFIDAYRLDLRYIKKFSFLLDLRILLKTVSVVVSGRGAN